MSARRPPGRNPGAFRAGSSYDPPTLSSRRSAGAKLLLLFAVAAAAAELAACGLVDFDGLTGAPTGALDGGVDASDRGSSGTTDGGDGADRPSGTFCQQHAGSAFCEDFEDPALRLEQAFEDRVGTAYEVAADPNDAANRVLSVQSDFGTVGETRLMHRFNASKAERIELAFRFRILSCNLDYNVLTFLKLSGAGTPIEVGLAAYLHCASISADAPPETKDAGKVSGDTQWHTASLVIARDASGAMNVGSLAIDGRQLDTIDKSSTNYDTCTLTIGSFFTSSQGGARVVFDDILMVVAP